MTSRPLTVGKLDAPNTPPTWLPLFGVNRSLPLPCASVFVAQLSSGGVEVLPAAVRQATLVPEAVKGLVTVPTPSTVLLAKELSNSTVPTAAAGSGGVKDVSRPASSAMTVTSAAKGRTRVGRVNPSDMSTTAGRLHGSRGPQHVRLVAAVNSFEPWKSLIKLGSLRRAGPGAGYQADGTGRPRVIVGGAPVLGRRPGIRNGRNRAGRPHESEGAQLESGTTPDWSGHKQPY